MREMLSYGCDLDKVINEANTTLAQWQRLGKEQK